MLTLLSRWGAMLLVILMTGCASTVAVRTAQLSQLPLYADAKQTLPPPPTGTMRLVIYRPQALVGMLGSAIVVVDGHRMGDPANPVVDNRLQPGAVFVVDVPAKPTRVWWLQSGRVDEDKAIELAPSSASRHYLRWTLAATHGHLSVVPEAQALPDLDGLRFSGYVRLGQP